MGLNSHLRRTKFSGEKWWTDFQVLCGCWTKNRGFYPQIIHFNRVFPYFHHPFWGTTIFGNTHVNLWGVQNLVVWSPLCYPHLPLLQGGNAAVPLWLPASYRQNAFGRGPGGDYFEATGLRMRWVNTFTWMSRWKLGSKVRISRL